MAVITTTYFFSMVWVIAGFTRIRGKKKNISKDEQSLKISVIIPFRNEEKHLLNCLNSFHNQTFKNNCFEVILVNDHSTDRSVKIVESFVLDSDINVRLTSLTDKSSKKEALKYGVDLAIHEIIATTDADCLLPKSWLNNIANHFSNEVDMLLGPVMFNNAPGFLAAFQTLDMLAIQGVEFGALGFNKPILNNAANLSYSLASLNNVDGFDSFNTPSGDDVFLLEKFKFQNKKIEGLLSDDFIVETKPETNFSSFFNQRVRWASKSKYYKDKFLILSSGLVLIQNVSLLFIYSGILFDENHRLIFLFLLITKWLIDFILLFLVSSFFKRKSVMFYFIPVQLAYPFYVIIIWSASVLLKFEWKGRKY